MTTKSFSAPDEKELAAAFENAHDHHCTIDSWLLFSTAAITGAGAALSFDSKEELTDFVYRFPLLWASSELAPNELGAAEGIRQLVQLWKSREMTGPEVASKINELRGRGDTICWLGSVRSLLSGEDEFATDARREFLGSSEETSKGSKIPAERIQDFLDGLSDWGA